VPVPTPSDFWSGFKVTDLVTAVAACLAAAFAFLQWRVYIRQADIAQGTREIAYSALDRPYMLIEEAIHNRNEWRDGAGQLFFRFRVQNYGNGPGIIREIRAGVFLSTGLGDPQTVNRFPAIAFPEASWLAGLLIGKVPVTVDPETRHSPFGRAVGTIVLAPGATSPLLGQSADMTYRPPPPPLHHWHTSSRQDGTYKRLTPDGDAVDEYPDFQEVRQRCGSMPVWLVGELVYEGILGRKHYTRFCFRGGHDSSAVEEYGPPYNQRT